MIDWYLKNRRMLQDLKKKAIGALDQYEDNNKNGAKTIAEFMKSDFILLRDHWHSRFPEETFGYLGRHIGFAMQTDFNDIINHDIPEIEVKLDQILADFQKSLPNSKTQPYVADERLRELSGIESDTFDTTKLIRLLAEINTAYNNDSFLSIGILVRATIDHVPPIFGCNTFAEVANNYGGTRSFRGAMKHLNDSLRNLADSYLHIQIRRKETLPTINQVDFRVELDALLAEIYRVLSDV